MDKTAETQASISLTYLLIKCKINKNILHIYYDALKLCDFKSYNIRTCLEWIHFCSEWLQIKRKRGK